MIHDIKPTNKEAQLAELITGHKDFVIYGTTDGRTTIITSTNAPIEDITLKVNDLLNERIRL